MLHYVEKPETYVSDTINGGAYLFSSEIFKHMAQVFDEQYKIELVMVLYYIHPYTVVWKTFNVKKISYDSLVTKFKHTNIIPLQNFSHKIYLNYSYL